MRADANSVCAHTTTPQLRAFAYAASTKPRLKLTGPDMMMETMTPNRPSAEPKISITRILTNSVLFCASLSAHELPMMPTHNLRPPPRQRPACAATRLRVRAAKRVARGAGGTHPQARLARPTVHPEANTA